uniref:Uncharacterized protein n=1 Tax=Anguilla anguilla TaxID=7936 RepID=A0A0E9QA62_ANGAN
MPKPSFTHDGSLRENKQYRIILDLTLPAFLQPTCDLVRYPS